MAEGNQQQPQDPIQRLALALSHIRRVQNHVELNYPAQGNTIKYVSSSSSSSSSSSRAPNQPEAPAQGATLRALGP
jgi:hypothetical protein